MKDGEKFGVVVFRETPDGEVKTIKGTIKEKDEFLEVSSRYSDYTVHKDLVLVVKVKKRSDGYEGTNSL